MLDKKKLIQEYKNTIPQKGIYAVRNKENGRVFLASTLNLYNIADRLKFRLTLGNFPCASLVADWQRLGEAAFTIEILETLPPKEDPAYDYDEDLKILELLWLDTFQPLSEKCYNENERIRLV